MWQWLKKMWGDKEAKIVAGTAAVSGATKYPGVVVGRIIEVQEHPNADRLKVAKVNVGKQQLDIVCGGPNVTVGQLVPVAVVGTKLPNGLTIKEMEIRGVKSFGMICAEDELGLGQNHEAIMTLKPEAVVGESIDAHL